MICLEEDNEVFQMPCCGARIHRACIVSWTEKGGGCPVCDTPLLGKLSTYEFAQFDEFERHRYDLCKLFRRVLRSKRSLSVVWIGFRRIRFSRNKTHISLIYKNKEYNVKYTVVDVYPERTCMCIDPPLRYVVFIEFDTTHNICVELKHMRYA
jgi:hypothetical protein